MTKSDKKYSLKTLIVTTALGVVMTASLSPVISIPIELLMNKIVSMIVGPPYELGYKILSDSILSRSELDKVIRDNFSDAAIDYSMDDDIISTYHVTTVELRNKGHLIEDNLVMDVDFKDKRVKILDVFAKLIEPEVKELEIEVDRPPLVLDASIRDRISFTLQIDRDDSVLGSIFYRSYLPKAGFGRRSPAIQKGVNFSDFILRDQKVWYSASHIGKNGLESELSDAIPAHLAPMNQFNFANAKKLDIKDVRNRDRARPHDPAPPTPPGIRITYQGGSAG